MTLSRAFCRSLLPVGLWLATATLLHAQGPDLRITKTDSNSGFATQGQTGFIFTITVSSTSNAATVGQVTVTESVPPGLTPTGMSGTGWTCTQPAGPCTRSDSIQGIFTSYPPISLVVNVAGNAPPSITNTATVSGGGDTNSANNSGSDTVSVAQLPDFAITKTHAPPGFTRSQIGATYTITVQNTGTGRANFDGQAVTVTDIVPSGLVATSISGGSSWNCTQPAGPCSISSSLNAGQFYPPLTLTVNVDPSAPSVVTNTATVSCNCSVEGLASTVAMDQTIINSGVVTPVITSLGASPTSVETLPPAITSGTPIPSFTLFIHGAFDPTQFVSVSWFDTLTNSTTRFGPTSGVTITQNLITVQIPNALFSTLVSAPDNVLVAVSENSPFGGVSTSAPAAFQILPPLMSLGPTLPSGMVGSAYSQKYFTGGTPAYQSRLTAGALPDGLSFSSDATTIVGTPTKAGNFQFTVSVTDAWGNVLSATDSILITTATPAPTITSVVPNSTSAGISSAQIIVNGTNFTPLPAAGVAAPVPGSVVSFTPPGGTPVALSTSFVSSTQLAATIPGNLLTAPEVATITVSQSGGVSTNAPVTSNGVPFTVRAPSISSLNPSGAAPSAPGFTLTVTGADFVSNAAPPASSQILFGGTPLVTTFVNSTTLTAPITSAMIATPGPINVVVQNPGGSLSAPAIFTVSAGIPTLTNLNPNSTLVGGPAFTLTATGTNLISGMAIQFNGTSLVATCVGNANASPGAPCAQLATTVPANLIATAGVVGVTAGTTGSVLSNSLPFTIVPKLIITTVALPNGAPGINYSFTLTAAGGVPAYSWTATGLPTGLTVNAATGVISGATATSGVFPVSVTVTDQSGQAANAQFNLTIISKLLITTTSLPNGIVGGVYTATLTSSGGTAPLTWSAAGLPGGLSINAATGVISGTPTTAGTTTVTITLNDSSGQSTTAQLPLTIVARLVITTTSLPPVSPGANYSATLTASGGLPPYTWSATGLPSGLLVNASTGVISGVATASGNFTVTVTVRDSSNIGGVPQTATAQFALSTVAKLIITSSNLAGATAGVPFNSQLTATGGIPPYTWSATGLAPGLVLNPVTGVISGTPTAASTGTVNVTVTDTSQQIATASFPFNAIPAPPPQLQIVTPSVPNGTVTVPYAAAIAASGGTPPYSFSLAGGALPDGLSLTNDGVIAGTPTVPGPFRFTVRVTDTGNGVATRDYSITIAPAPLTVTGSVSDLVVGDAIGFKFGATGGVPPYSFGAGGTLPPGAKFGNDGSLTGTATGVGTFSFTVSVTDKNGASASKGFTITVTAAPLVITTSSLGSAEVGVPLSVGFAATGGVPPITWSGGGAGLSFNGNVLSGTPATAGTFTIAVTATDSVGTKANKSFTLVVADLLQITTSTLSDGIVGQAYSGSLGATGGVPPYSFSASGLPDGVSIASGGAISGTPTTRGTFTVSAKVTDSGGGSATKSFTVIIAPPTLTITTTALPNGTVGSGYNATLQATGGVPPLTWKSTATPAGISVAGDGTISGTPTTAGASNVAVTVTDSAGGTASASIPVTVVLPPPPTVVVSGAPPTSNSTAQINLKISLDRVFPAPVTVTLTLNVAPVSGQPPQDAQFSNGGQTFSFVVPANTPITTQTDVFVQVGSVAGTFTVTERLTSAGQDVTPSPAPTQTIQVAPSVPVLTGNPSVTATRNANGFTVVATGFSNTREITQVQFQFTAAAGANVQTSQVTIPGDALFGPYYASAASNATGGGFKLTQPFNVQGNAQSIVSVTVIFTNRVGNSQPATVNLQ